jgi:hypothetical protein
VNFRPDWNSSTFFWGAGSVLRAAFERAREAAGDDQAALLELDTLFNELSLARQEDGFNVGCDHGTVDGYAKAFTVFHGREHSETYHTLLRGIRAMVLLTDLPRALRVAAVTEAAWSLSMSMADSPLLCRAFAASHPSSVPDFSHTPLPAMEAGVPEQI